MSKKNMNKIIKAANDLKEYCIADSVINLNFDDIPFKNFVELLYPILSEDEFYNDELYFYAVENFCVTSISDLMITEDTIVGLIEYIKTVFELNKEKHYIIFPLQGSGLKQDIHFSKFHLLTQKNEAILIEQLFEICKKKVKKLELKEFMHHTKRSRSKDFLNSNIMVIEIEHQTETIKSSAYETAQYAIDIIKLLYYANDFKSSMFRKSALLQEKNKHVAIVSKDLWRCGHGYNYNAHLMCKIDIDFMEDKKIQNDFRWLFGKLTNNKGDELDKLFANAFSLFSRGINQREENSDIDVSVLLYLTALESLFTENHNEKRLRIAASVPKFIKCKDDHVSNLSYILDNLYLDRNNFLHAGKSMHFSEYEEKYDILQKTVAKVIVKWIKIDKLLAKNENTKRINLWTKYIDDIFKSLIYNN